MGPRGRFGTHDVEKLYEAMQNARSSWPRRTDCLAPIGVRKPCSAGLLKEVKAEFFTATTRRPTVYRGNPFQIEIGIAYGGELGPGNARKEGNGNNKSGPAPARVIRFANRVPLLYQQIGLLRRSSRCWTSNWRNYSLSQARAGPCPPARLVILVHMASVWVPFTSESKEAIADYDEIRKEIKLAIAECGRRLATLLRRKRTRTAHAKRRDVFTRYIGEVVEAVRSMTRVNKDDLRQALLQLAEDHTEKADLEFDEHGEIIKSKPDRELEHTVVVDRSGEERTAETLFAAEDSNPAPTKRARAKRANGRKKSKR